MSGTPFDDLIRQCQHLRELVEAHGFAVPDSVLRQLRGPEVPPELLNYAQSALDEFNRGIGTGAVMEGIQRSLDRHIAEMRQIVKFPEQGLVRSATEAFDQYRTALTSVDPALWSHSLDDIRTIAASFDAEVAQADTRSQRLIIFRDTASALIQILTGVQLPITNERLARAALVIVVLCAMVNQCLEPSLVLRQVLEHTGLRKPPKASRHLDAEAALAIAIAYHAATSIRPVSSHKSTNVGVVRQAARLREGPSPQSDLLTALPARTRVRRLGVYGRWTSVDVLTDSGEPTGLKGWIYRRNLRFD